jgi:hypothetical protein
MNITQQVHKMISRYGKRYGVIGFEQIRCAKGSHNMIKLFAIDGFMYDTPIPLNRDILRVQYVFQEFARAYKSHNAQR